MTKLRMLFIIITVLLMVDIIAVSLLLFKSPNRHGDAPPKRGHGGPKRIIIERLHFNADQIIKYETLIRQHQFCIKNLNDSIQSVKNELYHSLSGEKLISKDSLIDRLGYLQRKIELTHYNHFMAIKKICNNNQLTDFNNLTKDLAYFFSHKNS